MGLCVEIEVAKARVEAELNMKRRHEEEREAAELDRRIEVELIRIKNEITAQFETVLEASKVATAVEKDKTREEKDKVQQLQTELLKLSQNLSLEIDKREKAEEERDNLQKSIHSTSSRNRQAFEGMTFAQVEEEDTQDGNCDSNKNNDKKNERDEVGDINCEFRRPAWRPKKQELSPSGRWLPTAPEPPLSEDDMSRDNYILENTSEESSDIMSQTYRSKVRNGRAYQRRKRDDHLRRELKVIREEIIDPFLEVLSIQRSKNMFGGPPVFVSPVYGRCMAPARAEEDPVLIALDSEARLKQAQSVKSRQYAQMEQPPAHLEGHEVRAANQECDHDLSPRVSSAAPGQEESEDGEDIGAKLADGYDPSAHLISGMMGSVLVTRELPEQPHYYVGRGKDVAFDTEEQSPRAVSSQHSRASKQSVATVQDAQGTDSTSSRTGLKGLSRITRIPLPKGPPKVPSTE